MTVTGERYKREGTGVVLVRLPSGAVPSVEVLVVSTKPLNLSFILGMNVVKVFGGVTVRGPRDVFFFCFFFTQ